MNDTKIITRSGNLLKFSFKFKDLQNDYFCLFFNRRFVKRRFTYINQQLTGSFSQFTALLVSGFTGFLVDRFFGW